MSETQLNNEETVNKTNDIEARREARRRKILENSKSRLEKLNGRREQTKSTINGFKQPKVSEIYPDPEIYLPDNINDEFSPISSFNINSPPSLQDQEAFFELFNQFSPMLNKEQRTTKNKLNTLITSKLHLVIISILTYVLFATGNDKYISYRVFFPLFIWEIIEMLLLENHEKPNSLFLVLLMLVGIPSDKTQPLLKIIGTLNKVFKDVGVFVFVFVLTHLIYSCFDKNVGNLHVVADHRIRKTIDMDSGSDFDDTFLVK